MDVVVDWGPERFPEALLEQSWPRRAPRVVLGYEVLRRWCVTLLAGLAGQADAGRPGGLAWKGRAVGAALDGGNESA